MKKMKDMISNILLVLVMIIGLSLLLYPTVSDYWNSRVQSYAVKHYQDEVAVMDQEKYNEIWDAAIAYNRSLAARENMYKLEVSNQLTYHNMLNVGGSGIMGYIEIPAINVNLPIYHGTDSETLDAGIGHLLGTSLPVGGSSTHTVLTAHSGMANQKLFSDLDKLEKGDVFYLRVLDEDLAYQVDDINTVLPHESSLLEIVEDEDYCTLVTCTPFGINTHRLLVRGTRIPYEEAEEIVEEQIQFEEKPTSTWMEQYLLGLFYGSGVVLVAGIVYLIYRSKKRGKYEED